VDVLDTHHGPVEEHGEQQMPVLRRRTAVAGPVVLDDRTGRSGRLLIGPRLRERHDRRVVDTLGGQLSQRGKFLGRGQPQFESRRGEP
jgi:hypothetical protein